MNIPETIREEGSTVQSERTKEIGRSNKAKKRAADKHEKVKNGTYRLTGFALNKENINRKGRPKTSFLSKVTEYGDTFDRLNQERLDAGLQGLRTPLEILIEALNSPDVDPMDKLEIANRLMPYQVSKAPVVSIDHVKQVNQEIKEAVSPEEELANWLSTFETKE